MRRRPWLTVLVVLVAAVLGAWWFRARLHGDHAAANGAADEAKRAQRAGAFATRTRLADPLTGRRGKIAGKVSDGAGKPIVNASVCGFLESEELSSNETREPVCTRTDVRGVYELDDLVAARYEVSASAAGFVPARYRDGKREYVELSLGEALQGIDLTLAPKGVELHGIVKDISGGVVAGATVTASGGMFGTQPRTVTKSDVQGRFLLFVGRGRVEATASAIGYTSGSKTGTAPGQLLEILLTPESVLTGQVVDAVTRAPVAGAQVVAELDAGPSMDLARESQASAFSDREGKFRLERLPPGRYKPSAEAPGLRGTARESVLIGLGQTSGQALIELHRAIEVSGRVVIAQADQAADASQRPCVDGSVTLTDKKRKRTEWARSDQQGVVWWKAILPGSYVVRVECAGLLPRDAYPPVVIEDKNVAGLLWAVSEGRRISGLVVDAEGSPVADARVTARKQGADPRADQRWLEDTTRQDGKFALEGLVAGEYELEASAPELATTAEPIKVVLPPAQDVDNLRVTLQRGGDIEGTVMDEDGAPVSGMQIDARGARWSWGQDATSRDDGTFDLKGLAPGPYRVVARTESWDGFRAPGSSDDDVQGRHVTVQSGRSVHVKLTVERQSGRISGQVLDARGKPVSDAFVDAERESESAAAAEGGARRQLGWGWERQPVLTEMDGRFVLKKLSPGRYTVHAYRRGGGDAISEHVQVGSAVTLTIRATGGLSGTVSVRGAAAPESFSITIAAPKEGFDRSEDFFRSGGAWSMNDLPAGTYHVSADAPEGAASLEVSLAEGERREGVALELQPHTLVRGRVVDLQSGAPVPGLKVSVTPQNGGGSPVFMMDGNGGNEVSDSDGRFEVDQAPVGRAFLVLVAVDFEHSSYGFSRVPVRVETGKVNELADTRVAKQRVTMMGRRGDLGFEIKASAPDEDAEMRRLVVAVVRSDGPAARAGLRVGDVITTVDGYDVTGMNSYLYSSLVAIPEGATVELRLERGATVRIVASDPL